MIHPRLQQQVVARRSSESGKVRDEAARLAQHGGTAGRDQAQVFCGQPSARTFVSHCRSLLVLVVAALKVLLKDFHATLQMFRQMFEK